MGTMLDDVNLLPGLPRTKKEHDAFYWTTMTSNRIRSMHKTF